MTPPRPAQFLVIVFDDLGELRGKWISREIMQEISREVYERAAREGYTVAALHIIDMQLTRPSECADLFGAFAGAGMDVKSWSEMDQATRARWA